MNADEGTKRRLIVRLDDPSAALTPERMRTMLHDVAEASLSLPAGTTLRWEVSEDGETYHATGVSVVVPARPGRP